MRQKSRLHRASLPNTEVGHLRSQNKKLHGYVLSTKTPPIMTDSVDFCPQCLKLPAICVCDRITPLTTRTAVLILQHPQEQDVQLGSARLVTLSLPNSKLKIGLSWRSLAHALERDQEPDTKQNAHKNERWAVVFPQTAKTTNAIVLPPAIEQGAKITYLPPPQKSAESSSMPSLTGFIVLDGTWSQAKTLWWRNPWLTRLDRITLEPREPSIYGRVRREPRRSAVSTLEATAEVLTALGEPIEVRDQLRRLLRTLVQRYRDANSPQ